jgi:hypothetical protein
MGTLAAARQRAVHRRDPARLHARIRHAAHDLVRAVPSARRPADQVQGPEQAVRPRSERMFSLQEFIRDLDIPEFAAADEAYRVAQSRVTSIAAQHREFLTGRSASWQSIERALSKQGENPGLLDEAVEQPGGKDEE